VRSISPMAGLQSRPHRTNLATADKKFMSLISIAQPFHSTRVAPLTFIFPFPRTSLFVWAQSWICS
jgi:hypothetical protein